MWTMLSTRSDELCIVHRPRRRDALDTLRAPSWYIRSVVVVVAVSALTQPAVAAEHQPGGSALLQASLEEMQQRALPWSSHLTVEPALTGEPAAYVLRGLLTQQEITALIRIAQQGMSTHQEPHSSNHATVSLDKAPVLNASAAVASLNARLAALAGLPESHVEDGYFSVYTKGHEMHSMHLDNHHVVFSPARFVSFVVYLVGEPDGLVGGGTVFPLAATGAPEFQGAGKQKLQRWDSALRSAKASFRLGQDPQRGRVCTSATRSSLAPCQAVMAVAGRLCKSAASSQESVRRATSASSPALVQARPGDALMFYQFDAAGYETAKAIHASCPVDAGNKVVLAKFVRAGPKPFDDEAAFLEARRHWIQSRTKDEI
mmetsp:Transcript_96580/g.300385  ORF Transcript_96580/g.300385 Transcript_96580/m.300385 type:complete len:374 (+) Transcript_96580:75-1196(+)